MRNKPLPTSKKSALLQQRRLYLPKSACEDCGGNTARYTANDKCVVCSAQDAREFYDECLAAGRPVHPEAAIDGGYDCYVNGKACDLKGHVGLRNFQGKCKLCADERAKPGRATTPRSIARSLNQPNYTPTTFCAQALHKSTRRVADDLCYECRDNRRKCATITKGYMQAHPTGPLPLAAAKALGFTMFWDDEKWEFVP